MQDCSSVDLIVTDGIPPDAAMTTPNGGESWAYSADTVNRQRHLVVERTIGFANRLVAAAKQAIEKPVAFKGNAKVAIAA